MGEFDLGNTFIESSSLSIASEHDPGYRADEGVTTKMFREAHMISSGIGGAFADTARDPLSKADDLALAGSAGVGFKMLQRSGAKGKTMAAAIGVGMGLKMLVDEYTGDRWSTFGGAVSDTWHSPANYDRNVAITKASAGAFAVDTTVAVVGFKAAGTKTGSKLLFGEGSTKLGSTNPSWVGREAQLAKPNSVHLLAEIKRAGDGKLGVGTKPPSKSSTGPMETYQQAGYRHIPPRELAAQTLVENSIPIPKLADGVKVGPSTKPWNNKAVVRGVAQYMESRAAVQNLKGSQFDPWVGRQAQLIEPAVFDAALAEATGIKPTTKSFTVKPMEAYQQPGYRHIPPRDLSTQVLADGVTTGPSTVANPILYDAIKVAGDGKLPGSSGQTAWSWEHVPATEVLLRNSIPISSSARAVASNLSLQKAPPWAAGGPVRGSIQYIEARAAAESALGSGNNAWIGKEAPILKPAAVDAAMAEATGNSSVFRGNAQ